MDPLAPASSSSAASSVERASPHPSPSLATIGWHLAQQVALYVCQWAEGLVTIGLLCAAAGFTYPWGTPADVVWVVSDDAAEDAAEAEEKSLRSILCRRSGMLPDGTQGPPDPDGPEAHWAEGRVRTRRGILSHEEFCNSP